LLARVAELLGAPVIDQGDRANLPLGHPLHLTGDSTPLESADTVLLLDSEVPWVPVQRAPPDDARVVQIDKDPVKASMPLWSYPVEIALTADTRVALLLLEQTLLRLANGALREKWSARRRTAEAEVAQRREEAVRRAASDLPADAPDAVLAALGRALPENAVVVAEAVTNRPALGRQVHRPPGQFFDTGGPALGWALGGAFGMKLARPDAPIVAICGDGFVQLRRAHRSVMVGASLRCALRHGGLEQPLVFGVPVAGDEFVSEWNFSAGERLSRDTAHAGHRLRRSCQGLRR
jgi:acetolactate synthase-1/2/3 large subunit